MSTSVSSTPKSNYSYLQTASGRYTGLASGIDTESIVEKLMKAQSAPKEKLQQQYQTFGWKRDSYRDFYSKLSTLNDDLFDKYALTSSWSTKKATSSDSSVSVSATSAASGSLTLSNIAIAKNNSQTGSINTTTYPNISGSSKLSDIGINGTNGYFTLNVLQNDGSMKATTIKYSASDTIDTFVKNINNSGSGVTAIFSGSSLSLTTNATGKNALDGFGTEVISTPTANQISGYTENANIFTNFGFSGSGLVANGQNATFTVNGISMEKTSNTFALNGYNLTLNNNNTTSNVAISSSADVDAVVDKVKAFVSSYNDLISSMRTATTEKKNLDYPPLTDAQKADMSESQIAAWETKAKAGILKRDPYLEGVTNSLRSTMSSKLVGQGTDNYLYQIGVTTTKSYTDGGKLQIDEVKLRKAIQTDPDSVVKLFTGTNSDDGIVNKARKELKSGMDSIERVAGKTDSVENTYSLGTQMIGLKSKIDDWTSRLKDIENRYWNQFTAMETAISKANSVQSVFG